MNVWIDGSPAIRQTQQGRIAIAYEDGRTLAAEIGSSTVNEAEYLALIEALNSCKQGDVINTDSQLLVGQLTMGWKVRAENLKEIHRQAKALLEKSGCRLALVGRKDNRAGKLMESMPGYRHARTG
jgi:ribonuclease HI